MLIIGRRMHETVHLTVPPSSEPTEIELQIMDIRPRAKIVRLGITAPREVQVVRDDAKLKETSR